MLIVLSCTTHPYLPFSLIFVSRFPVIDCCSVATGDMCARRDSSSQREEALLATLFDGAPWRESCSADVLVRYCLRVCDACGVPQCSMLCRMPPDTASRCAGLFMKALLTDTYDTLLRRRQGEKAWLAFSCCFHMCSEWLLPAHMKWRRSSSIVEPLWALLTSCRALLWLAGRRNHRWSRQAALLLDERYRWALWREDRPPQWPESERARAISSLVHLQWLTVSGAPNAHETYGATQTDCTALYSWVSHSSYYVGIAHVHRPRQRNAGGIACRWLEHAVLFARRHMQDSGKLRYRIMRRLRLEETFFFVARAGPSARVRAMETLEIASRRPPANLGARDGSDRVAGPNGAGSRRRGRPPKWFRAGRGSRSCCRGPFDSAPARLAIARGSRAHGPEGGDRSRALPQGVGERGSFQEQYCTTLRRRVAVHGTHGPVDIYNPAWAALFATWCGTQAGLVDWALLERKWQSGCGPASAAPHVGRLQDPGRRLLATRRVNAALRERSLPPVGGTVVRVPRDCMKCVIKRVVLDRAQREFQFNRKERVWFQQHVRFVSMAERKHRDKWNAVAVSKRLQATDVLSGDVSAQVAACGGSGMERIEKLWDVPCRTSRAEDAQSASRCVLDACRRLRFSRNGADVAARRASQELPADPIYRAEQAQWARTARAYADYTSDMQRGEHEALVPDDKENKFMWRMPVGCYLWLLVQYAVLAPSWVLTSMTVDQANTRCWQVLNSLLSPALQRFLGFAKYRHVLPYYYATIKSKCFSAGRKVCSKPLHSCVRKVVSCASWPGRKRWRSSHRALQAVGQAHGGETKYGH